jgi:hypothetical protein
VGLYDFGARAYAPQIGRFVSADTVWSRANPQGSNPYAFVLDNPLKHTDPDGHYGWVVVTGIAGGVIGGAWAAYEHRHLSGEAYALAVGYGAFRGAAVGVIGGLAGPHAALGTLGMVESAYLMGQRSVRAEHTASHSTSGSSHRVVEAVKKLLGAAGVPVPGSPPGTPKGDKPFIDPATLPASGDRSPAAEEGVRQISPPTAGHETTHQGSSGQAPGQQQ